MRLQRIRATQTVYALRAYDLCPPAIAHAQYAGGMAQNTNINNIQNINIKYSGLNYNKPRNSLTAYA